VPHAHAVTIADVAPIATLVVRRPAGAESLKAFVPSACGTVWEFLRARGLRGGHNIALYLNGKSAEAGVVFDGTVEPAGVVERSALPSGRAARTMHRGPYDTLGAGHQAVREWCQREGHVLAGPSWEVYGHWREEWNANPSMIETEVYWLLR
jgi:effector-binding domain-containing protein